MLTEDIYILQSDHLTQMYSTIFPPVRHPSGFEIIFSFFLAILIIHMISSFFLSYIPKEEEME